MAAQKCEWDPRRGPEANARRVLPLLVTEYFRKVRKFLRKQRKPEKLHRMRLLSKRLRYTLELFRPCYDTAFEERIGALKTLQDALGDLNDAVVVADMVRKSAGPDVHKFLTDRADEKLRLFRTHWEQTFDAPGQEKWWTDFLSKPHAAKSRKAR